MKQGCAQLPFVEWSDDIPDAEWRVYERAINEAQRQKLEFALGGAFAIAVYTNYWRNTKDLDFYLLPASAPAMIDLLQGMGARDYHSELAYDRRWIYRARIEDCIIDVIWAMANQKTDVDRRWLTAGPEVTIRGSRLRVIPVEELIWAKLYVLQKARSDWPDIFNLLYCQAAVLDWRCLLQRAGDDIRLLAAAVLAFAWLCPAKARELPEWLWQDLGIPAPAASAGEDTCRERTGLLDRNDWFVPFIRGGRERYKGD